MAEIKLVIHAKGAPGLRLLGLGPNFMPRKGLLKLQQLLNKHAFWAKGRSERKLRRLLAGSTVVVSLWHNQEMIGFGRATSDGICRAVLWDVVVNGNLQGQGLGTKVVEALISTPSIKNAERIYLMTTNRSDFYLQLGFKNEGCQTLLVQKPFN